ncbi:hypothetical protein D3C72_1986050 [compost metagenome]
MPWSISRWRMPPLCFISTWPETSLTLQVPHIPCVHDAGSRTPDCRAASSTCCPAPQMISRWLFAKLTLNCAVAASPFVAGTASPTASSASVSAVSVSNEKLSSW